MERVDFDESFTLVARLESIRIFMSIACTMNFKLYQMDVKCAKIEESPLWLETSS